MILAITDTAVTIIAIAAFLVMAIGVIFFVLLYQRNMIRHQHELNEREKKKELELLKASVQGEENERNRIASELHDDVGATLASVKLFLHSQNDVLKDNAVFVQSRDLIDETIKKVRSISHKLQPATLYYLGLAKTLESFFDALRSTGALKVTYNSVEVKGVGDEISLAVYRVIQELTNNTIKHSQATALMCELDIVDGSLRVTFAHDGDGLTNESFADLACKKNAIGLKNIITRLKAVKGSIDFKHAASLFETKIIVPL